MTKFGIIFSCLFFVGVAAANEGIQINENSIVVARISSPVLLEKTNSREEVLKRVAESSKKFSKHSGNYDYFILTGGKQISLRPVKYHGHDYEYMILAERETYQIFDPKNDNTWPDDFKSFNYKNNRIEYVVVKDAESVGIRGGWLDALDSARKDPAKIFLGQNLSEPFKDPRNSVVVFQKKSLSISKIVNELNYPIQGLAIGLGMGLANEAFTNLYYLPGSNIPSLFRSIQFISRDGLTVLAAAGMVMGFGKLISFKSPWAKKTPVQKFSFVSKLAVGGACMGIILELFRN